MDEPLWVLNIGEYSARKIYFFPSQRKNCEKFPPMFHLQNWKSCPKLHFFEKKLSTLAFFGGEIAKI